MDLKEQNIIAVNKRQLISAIGHAIDFPGITNITLEHKKGIAFYEFVPSSYRDVSWYNYNLRKLIKVVERMSYKYFE